MDNPDTRNIVRSGLSWSLASRLPIQLIQFAVTVVTARLLLPGDFGAVGMVLVFSGFAQLLADGGFGAAIVHRPEFDDGDLSTAFWCQLAIGLVVTTLFYALSPTIAAFYDAPEVATLAQIVALLFVAQALGATQAALLQRRFAFRELAIAQLAAAVSSGTGCLLLLALGHRAIALAWQPVFGAVTFTTLVWLFSSWRPGLIFRGSAVRFVTSYGGWFSGNALLNYWFRNGDNLLIAKAIGAHELGLYSRAYALMMLPLQTISLVVGQVMFPILSRMQNDRARYNTTYAYTLQAIAFFAFPLMGCLHVLAEPVIEVVFGRHWLSAAPVLKVLSLVGLMQSVVIPVGWVFNSLGKPQHQFQVSLGLGGVFVVAMALGIQFGLIGVAYAYAAWACVSAVANFAVVSRLLGVSNRDLVRPMLPAAARTAAMMAVVSLPPISASGADAPFFCVALGAVVAFVAYWLSCMLAPDSVYEDVRTWVSRNVTRRLWQTPG